METQKWVQCNISEDYRRKTFRHFLKNHPKHVPMYIGWFGKSRKNNSEPRLLKFVVQRGVTAGELMVKIRKSLTNDKYITSKTGLFLLSNNSMIPLTSSLGELYDKDGSKDDGFLYMDVCSENVFG